MASRPTKIGKAFYVCTMPGHPELTNSARSYLRRTDFLMHTLFMGNPHEPTPPSVQYPQDIQDFTPKSRKGTRLSQHRSDTDGNRAINPNELKAWADDFRRHYAVSKLIVADFLLPSDIPYLVDHSSISSTFYGVPLDEGEPAMYDPLMSIISMLSQSEV